MFKKIPVITSTEDRYSITIGENLMEEAASYISNQFGKEKLFMIIDEQVYRLHNSKIEETLGQHFNKITKYVIPSGESNKSIVQFSSIIDFILQNGIERGTPLLAIGGGVIGDLAGFVAASILRGIPLIHMPTTLLAMVDSSIGGKTGVNHSTGKNLIGAFYQPKAVFADVDFLNTLPHYEWVSGLSEVIKYAMIDTPELFPELIELTKEGIFASPEKWISVIEKSASIKVDIVSRDVKESGVREYLNFGHTFAHVIERMGNFEEFSHGQAVFAGMYAASFVSQKLNASIDGSNLIPFKPLYDFSLEKLGTDTNYLIELMLRDKKVKKNTIRLVLLEELGKPTVTSFSKTKLIKESWEYLMAEFI